MYWLNVLFEFLILVLWERALQQVVVLPDELHRIDNSLSAIRAFP